MAGSALRSNSSSSGSLLCGPLNLHHNRNRQLCSGCHTDLQSIYLTPLGSQSRVTSVPLQIEGPMDWGDGSVYSYDGWYLRCWNSLPVIPVISQIPTACQNLSNQIKQIGIILYSEPISHPASTLNSIFVWLNIPSVVILTLYSLQSPERAASLQLNSPAKYNLLLMEHLIWLLRTPATILTLLMCPYGF